MRNVHVWICNNVRSKVERIHSCPSVLKFICFTLTKPLSLCLQQWPPRSPAHVRRSSSLVWKIRTWPSVWMRGNAPSLKPWPGFTGTAGERDGSCVCVRRSVTFSASAFPLFCPSPLIANLGVISIRACFLFCLRPDWACSLGGKIVLQMLKCTGDPEIQWAAPGEWVLTSSSVSRSDPLTF